jgi:hypothetical protein
MEIGSSSNLTAGQQGPSTWVTIQPRADTNPPTPPPPHHLTTLHLKLLNSHPTNLNFKNPEIEDAANGMYFWRMLLYKRREVDWEISWPSDPEGTRLKDDCPDSPLVDMVMSPGNITDQPCI